MNLNTPVDKQSPVYQQNLIKSARSTLVIAVLFTALNIILLLTGSNNYFLYSATIPYYLTFFGYLFDYFTLGTYTLTGLTIAAVPVAALSISWYLSKKDSRWLTAATVIFALDTAAMVALIVWSGDAASMVIDIIFHAWVLICLIRGVKAAAWLKSAPIPEPIFEAAATDPDAAEQTGEEPTPIE